MLVSSARDNGSWKRKQEPATMSLAVWLALNLVLCGLRRALAPRWRTGIAPRWRRGIASQWAQQNHRGRPRGTSFGAHLAPFSGPGGTLFGLMWHLVRALLATYSAPELIIFEARSLHVTI